MSLGQTNVYILRIYNSFVPAKSHGKKVWWLKAAATHNFFPDMTYAKILKGEA